MATIPGKVSDRLIAGIKRFQPVLALAKTRDLNESDTVTIVTDILSEIFGYDKYSEVTSEYAIRNTFVDLAIKLDGVLSMLIEVKAIGLELKDAFVKQAVDYAANQGVDWVLLTNGAIWRAYKVSFTKPIDQELVLELDLQGVSHKSKDDIETLFLLTKEGQLKSSLGEYQTQRQALSRYSLSALILSDTIVDAIRRELRRLSPGVKIEQDEIRAVLSQEVLKREVVEGDKADEARRKVNRVAGKTQRARSNGKASSLSGANQSTDPTLSDTEDESATDASAVA